MYVMLNLGVILKSYVMSKLAESSLVGVRYPHMVLFSTFTKLSSRGNSRNGGYPNSWMFFFFQGKSHLKMDMDDIWGYPHFRKWPNMININYPWCQMCRFQLRIFRCPLHSESSEAMKPWCEDDDKRARKDKKTVAWLGKGTCGWQSRTIPTFWMHSDWFHVLLMYWFIYLLFYSFINSCIYFFFDLFICLFS